MSTKIYRGFKLKNKSMTEALAIFKRLGLELNKLAELKKESFLKRYAAYLQEPQSCTTDIQASNAWDARVLAAERTGRTDPAVTVAFEVAIYPLASGDIVGMTFGPSDWHTLVISDAEVMPYAWWNNTDKPDEISDEDWDLRGKDWGFLDSSPLAEQMLCLRLVSQSSI